MISDNQNTTYAHIRASIHSSIHPFICLILLAIYITRQQNSETFTAIMHYHANFSNMISLRVKSRNESRPHRLQQYEADK